MAILTNEQPRCFDMRETKLEVAKDGLVYTLKGGTHSPFVSVGDLEHIATITAQIVYNTIKSMPFNDCTAIIISATHN